MYNKDDMLEDNKQDRPSIFEDKKYIRSFCNRDFYKNIIAAKDVYIDVYNKKEEYTSTNILLGNFSEIQKSFIESNIVQMNTSYIIKDYDGELYYTYKDMLKLKGYSVKVINYMNTKESAKYNIFKYINYEEDVYNFVSMITKSNILGMSKGQKLLKNAENLLLEAIVYYIMSELSHEEHSIQTILKMLKLAYPKGDVSDEYDSDLNMLFVMLEKEKKEDSIALERYKQFLLASKHMEHIIIKNVENYMAIYSMNSLKNITNEDTVDIDEIFDNDKVAIFVIVPRENENYEYLGDTLITSFITYIQYIADQKYYGILPNKVHIITYNLIHHNILKLLKDVAKYNMLLSVGIKNTDHMMQYYENVYNVIDSFSMMICFDLDVDESDNNLIQEFIKFRIVEENKEHLDEKTFELSDYIEDDEDNYLILIKYMKPILGQVYDIKDNENYIEINEKAKDAKVESLKEELKNQIYRNLLSQIELNERTIKTKENVNIDIGSKNLVNDDIYSNITTKVNKPLIKDV